MEGLLEVTHLLTQVCCHPNEAVATRQLALKCGAAGVLAAPKANVSVPRCPNWDIPRPVPDC
jgi:hypothetical protein